MELRAGRHQETDLAPVSPSDRRDPQVRRRMSGPAMRAFFSVGAAWQLHAEEQRALLGWPAASEEQRALLGWPAASTFFKYKAGRVSILPYDMLMRISLILGIYKDLHILYPEPDLEILVNAQDEHTFELQSPCNLV